MSREYRKHNDYEHVQLELVYREKISSSKPTQSVFFQSSDWVYFINDDRPTTGTKEQVENEIFEKDFVPILYDDK